MRQYDFTPLYRSLVGFDRMAGLIDRAAQIDGSKSYPPYNIEQTSDDDYAIELAIAGFSEAELDIESREGVLVVTGSKAANDDTDAPSRNFLHRGIAERGFERQFQLADHVKVTGASLSHGLLRITLHREVPEALKPRKIAISGAPNIDAFGNDEKLIEQTSSRKGKAA